MPVTDVVDDITDPSIASAMRRCEAGLDDLDVATGLGVVLARDQSRLLRLLIVCGAHHAPYTKIFETATLNSGVDLNTRAEATFFGAPEFRTETLPQLAAYFGNVRALVAMIRSPYIQRDLLDRSVILAAARMHKRACLDVLFKSAVVRTTEKRNAIMAAALDGNDTYATMMWDAWHQEASYEDARTFACVAVSKRLYDLLEGIVCTKDLTAKKLFPSLFDDDATVDAGADTDTASRTPAGSAAERLSSVQSVFVTDDPEDFSKLMAILGLPCNTRMAAHAAKMGAVATKAFIEQQCRASDEVGVGTTAGATRSPSLLCGDSAGVRSHANVDTNSPPPPSPPAHAIRAVQLKSPPPIARLARRQSPRRTRGEKLLEESVRAGVRADPYVSPSIARWQRRQQWAGRLRGLPAP
jgi:hypothetical protein